MRLLLDTNVLIRLCHPKSQPGILRWFDQWMAYAASSGQVQVCLSGVVDYEARRGYLYRLGKNASHNDSMLALARLNRLCSSLPNLPMRESTWQLAARLWADARLRGFQSAPDHHIDWDVIIASQALETGAVVVTSNARHFAVYGADARDWPDITAPSD